MFYFIFQFTSQSFRISRSENEPARLPSLTPPRLWVCHLRNMKYRCENTDNKLYWLNKCYRELLRVSSAVSGVRTQYIFESRQSRKINQCSLLTVWWTSHTTIKHTPTWHSILKIKQDAEPHFLPFHLRPGLVNYSLMLSVKIKLEYIAKVASFS